MLNHNTFRRKSREKFDDLGFCTYLLTMTPKPQATKEKIKQIELHKILKNVLEIVLIKSKVIFRRKQVQITSDNGLTLRIYREYLKQQTKIIKNGYQS